MALPFFPDTRKSLIRALGHANDNYPGDRWGPALAALALGDTCQQRGRFAEAREPLTAAV